MGKLPSWYKGQMARCDICGYEYGLKEGKLFRNRKGQLVDKTCEDSIGSQGGGVVSSATGVERDAQTALVDTSIHIWYAWSSTYPKFVREP